MTPSVYPVLKPCRRCGRLCPLESFHRRKSAPDGRLNTCKDCANALARRDWKKRKQYGSVKPLVQLPLFPTDRMCRLCLRPKLLSDYRAAAHGHKGYSTVCKACEVRGAAIYYAAHRSQRLEYTRRWRSGYDARDPERKRRRRRAYLLKNPGYMRSYYAANKERIWEQQREYRAKHRVLVSLRCRVVSHRRRARRRAAEGTHSAADIEGLYREQDGLCYYCSAPLNGSYDVDHKQPVSKGGSEWPANLCCACARCNRSKGAKTEQQFWALLARGAPA